MPRSLIHCPAAQPPTTPESHFGCSRAVSRNKRLGFGHLSSALLCCLLVCSGLPNPCAASPILPQEPAIYAQPGQDMPVQVIPGQPVPGQPVPGQPTPGQPAPGQAGAPGSAKPQKPGNDSPEPKVIRRAEQKDRDADPEELKAAVGEDGKVAFQFRNQPWVDLIQWLAQIADKPLDWQELPGDKVNMSTPGRYTVAQTMDLFNRHLLARGYTLLKLPGGISVVKTATINPAMVPRVSPQQLTNLMPHTFVRVSLEVGWLSSEKLAVELKPMISSNGRLTALTTTNRIEAMDAAVNLQQIAELLRQEVSQLSLEAMAPEFKLRHIPAEVCKKLLSEFLKIEKKSSAAMNPQQLQMMQQMGMQGGVQPVQPGRASGGKTELSIVADTRRNAIFIRGPADRIALAAEFIKRIDVPGEGITSLADIESRIEVIRLYTIDPEKLIDIVNDMNFLEPGTHLESDSDNHALIVSGTAADRYMINQIVKRLDGSGRELHVLQLRRLNANEVAESIAFLMGDNDKQEDNSAANRMFYYGFGGPPEKKKKNDDKFRVAANSRYRQILLWANETELKQVQNLLVKLGEIPPPQGSRSPVRRIDASSTPETYDYLLQLQKQWQTLSPVPLVLPNQTQFVDPLQNDEPEDSAETEPNTEQESDAESKQPDAATTTSFSQTTVTTLAINQPPSTNPQPNANSEDATDLRDSAQGDPSDRSAIGNLIQSGEDFDRLLGRPPAPASSSEPKLNSQAQPSAPVQINLDRDGNLVLSGADPRVLDQLEDLMLRFAPPRRPYHVFRIRNQSAYWVHLNLTEYFESDEEESDDDDLLRWWIGAPSSGDDDGPTGLGKNAKLRFIYDPDTNTIVVSGATSTQLKTIAELIELWDVAEPVNKRSLRYTKLIQIKFGQATQIAETIKEAYRDLLSSNDKTFQRAPGGGGGEASGGGASGPANAKSSGRGNRGSGLTSDSGKDGGDVDFSFQGKLSMGIDPIGNTLLISAEGEPLLQLVEDMIKQLDEASQSAGHVEVYTLRGDTSSLAVETLLKTLAQKVKVQQGNGVVGANRQAMNTQAGQPQPNINPSAGGVSISGESF